MLTEGQVDLLHRLSAETGLSLSELIRRAIDNEYIQNSEATEITPNTKNTPTSRLNTCSVENQLLTQERVRELLNYNQETGLVTWNISINGRAPVGSVAGYVNGRGYRIITIDNHMYPAHRLIWMWMEGYFPESEIDHISGVRDDNRWCNLRHVSTSCNRVNRERGLETSG